MHPDTRRAALLATARIALSMTAAGCESATVAGTGATPGDLGQHPSQDTGTAPTTGAVCDPLVSDRTAVACCTARLDRALGDAGQAVTDPTDIACCRYLATQHDIALVDGGADPQIPHRGACCAALGWQGSITCTPWGPPVPPAMPPGTAA